MNIFLDSGAYSAFTRGRPVNIDEYITFIKKHIDVITLYANLDVIGDAEATYKNQLYMEAHGLSPIPTYHHKEPVKYLLEYVHKYPYIALGGMVGVRVNELMAWLDPIFQNYICDKKGMPRLKVHGFGITSVPLLVRYPWFSVDSTTWRVGGQYGHILIPDGITSDGSFNYLSNPTQLSVSKDSLYAGKEGKHISNFSRMERHRVEKFIESLGFTLDLLMVDSSARDTFNACYLLEVAKKIPKWPWPFVSNRKSFGLV